MISIEVFTQEFEKIRDLLKSFILRITASQHDTEDLVQETYIKATRNLERFRGESTVKTWIFAIAANLTKDNLRARKRWPEVVTDICRERALSDPDYFPEISKVMQSSPDVQFEVREHITFCLTCLTKSLPLEQHICLMLKEIYDFKITEIAEILQSNEAMIKYYLHTGRTKMVQIFEGRCSLINKNGTCHQCSELNGIFNPQQNFEIEKNKIELVRRAGDPNRERLMDLRFQIMKELDPFHSKGSALQLYHLENNRKVMEDLEKNRE